MGNCLSSQDPWTPLRRKQFVLKKVMRPSSSSTRKKSTFQITNVQNVPTTTNAVSVPSTSNVVNVPTTTSAVSVPSTSNVVNVPVKSTVVTVTGNAHVANVTVQDDMISTVVSRIIAGDPKKDVNVQINSFRNVSMFTYNELSMATSQFRPELILGGGGFGLVYKGVIDGNVRPGFPFTEVAVKELNPDGHQGDREWLTEVNYLGQFSHPNLVKLIGYCCEDEHRLLVYEYMACGSLETHLFRRHNTLSWSTRMNIALDAAKGLAFLHGAERPIIYRDFKTSNILLDGKFNAKLSDFGLAKEGPMGDQTHVSTRVMGTYGYAAPEYVMTGHLTARSDVYGFGVVLLELIVGKKAMDKRRPGHEHNLVNWSRPLLIRTTKLLKILDPKMEGQYSSKTASKVGNLTHRCLSENPKIRPTMSEVVQELETFNQEEIQIEKSKAAKRLLEISRAALDSHFAAEISKHDESIPNESDCQHGHTYDSDGQRNYSISVPYGNHSLNYNVIQKHSITVRNGCSPTDKLDGLQTDSRSAPNVAICI